jgi:hypothetical protein
VLRPVIGREDVAVRFRVELFLEDVDAVIDHDGYYVRVTTRA